MNIMRERSSHNTTFKRIEERKKEGKKERRKERRKERMVELQRATLTNLILQVGEILIVILVKRNL